MQQSLFPKPNTFPSPLLHAQEIYDLYRQEGMTERTARRFREVIYDYYQDARRSFSWREVITPYRVVVSEIMLQQTQTFRVATKFDSFVERFDSFLALANAPFDEVLKYWKGLGYNRRALNLQKIAQRVVGEHGGKLPAMPELLEEFPGIGHATARSICAFAFDAPTVFIETNIRAVFIQFFYPTQHAVHDKELMPLIAACLDREAPRQWYYALMDYGVMLKKEVGNAAVRSSHYTKQSKFEGSDRQVRGKILDALLREGGLRADQLAALVADPKGRTEQILQQLLAEGFVILEHGVARLRR